LALGFYVIPNTDTDVDGHRAVRTGIAGASPTRHQQQAPGQSDA